jgi:ribosomal protein S27AE
VPAAAPGRRCADESVFEGAGKITAKSREESYCYWKKVQLGSQFVTQVIRNGTGVIGTNEIVKAYNAGARNVCHVPTGGTTNNSFFSVDTGGNPITKIKGSHNTVLSDATGTPNPFNNNNPGLPEATGSIAVLPNDPISPTAPAFPFVFGDQLLLIDQNDVNDALGPRSVVDYCPDCGPGSFAAPAVAHVDVFNSRQSCGTGSGYKNDAPFVTIRLR